MSALLEVRALSKRFGGLVAVEDLSFTLAAGEILAIIGPNGAGKTTTFNLISGALTANSGEVWLDGRTVTGFPPHRIAGRGIMRTFQHNMPFASLTVLENVLVGSHRLMRTPWPTLMFGTGRGEDRAARRRAKELLEFVGLAEYADRSVGELSFGQGRLLETARALCGQPNTIMFDEPAAGLTPVECQRLARVIRDIASRGIAVLLIEHDMNFLLPLAHRVVVLNFGRKIADGPPETIAKDPEVITAYLGSTRRSRARAT